MIARSRLLLAPLGATFAMACASSGAAGSASAGASNSRSSDIITQEELSDPSLVGATVVDAVRRLRPRFLIDRSSGNTGSTNSLLASVDGRELVQPTELNRITVSEVAEIRYLSTSDAAQRFGMRGTMGPVILVTLKRR